MRHAPTRPSPALAPKGEGAADLADWKEQLRSGHAGGGAAPPRPCRWARAALLQAAATLAGGHDEHSVATSLAPRLGPAPGGVRRRGGARISADSRRPVFTRSNNAINGAAEEMVGVGDGLMRPTIRNGAAKATHMEELGRPCGRQVRLRCVGAWVPQPKYI
jgi:hypothetical protein